MSSISSNPLPVDKTAPAAGAPRPANPFAVKCRFDRPRGEFVIHAGARAGASAVVAFAVLAVGTVAFLRTCLRDVSTVTPAAGVVTSAVGPAVSTTPQVPQAPQPEPAPDGSYARRPGLNYVIVKSVPTKRAAVAAREALNRRGVATTVENSLPGWSGKGWYSLVGMTGFDLDRDEVLFDRYVKDLKAMKLDPKPYKWRGREVADAR